MSTCVTQNLPPSSPLKMFQASCRSNEKQGIVAILGSDSETSKVEPSLRRTLSADMSSKKWILSHMKKVASSEEISVSIGGSDEIWNSIKSQKDVLLDSSSKSSAAPYVHPLLKRSASSLSEKSLEICTESLGSETGSDGFSSENGDEEEEEEEENQYGETQTYEPEEWRPVRKYRYKKSPQRSFPPPLPTLAGPDGGTLRMQPRRDNGRLVVEAMAVPSQNNFRAKREDGRLVLTVVNRHFIKRVEEEDDDDQSEEEKDEEEQITEEKSDLKKNHTPESPCGLLNAHRLAVMMNSKSIVLANRNQSITPSLPPRRPKVAQPPLACPPPSTTATTAAASLNAYEYYWRSKPTTAKAAAAAAAANPLGQQPPSFKNSSRKLIVCKNRTANGEQPLVMSNGSCKEVRLSLLFWEGRCIATS